MLSTVDHIHSQVHRHTKNNVNKRFGSLRHTASDINSIQHVQSLMPYKSLTVLLTAHIEQTHAIQQICLLKVYINSWQYGMTTDKTVNWQPYLLQTFCTNVKKSHFKSFALNKWPQGKMYNYLLKTSSTAIISSYLKNLYPHMPMLYLARELSLCGCVRMMISLAKVKNKKHVRLLPIHLLAHCCQIYK